MANTFTYDLVSFLRVLYQRKGLIFKGTFLVTVVVMIASVLWPQTWRADARVLVTTPKYKTTLRLIPEPFDVLTYRGIMTSDNIYKELLDTLKWFKTAIDTLLEHENFNRMRDNLPGKADTLSPLQLIENTNLPFLTQLLVPEAERESTVWKTRIFLLGHLSDEEMEEIQAKSEADLEDLSVFDLRKMLHASVTVVKETNLETVYSNLISVSAEFDTAAGAKMVANTWVGLFLARAEEIVKENVVRQIQFTKDRATALEAQLAKTEQALTESQNSAHLEQRRSELASNLVSLTGVAPTYQKQNRTDEAFNLEDENAPFMKEKREALDTLSFSVAPTYSQALLPQLSELEQAALVSKQLAETVADPEQRGRLHERQQEQESQLAALRQRIASVQDEIRTDSAFIRTKETEIAGLERQRQQVLSSLQAIQPLLDEAMLLESSHGDTRYADVSAGWAIKPDKRSFPKRSLMTLAGLAVSFVLFCGLAFFVDIWDEVVKPEAETEEANVS